MRFSEIKEEKMSSLEIISWIFLGLGVLTALVLLAEVIAHPQPMRIMNFVWPITGLYFPIAGLILYRTIGRSTAGEMKHDMEHAAHEHHGALNSAKDIFLSSSHCGAGCVIGDIIGAPIVFVTGLTILGLAMYGEFVVEFILAYIFGVAFQYFPIRWMRKISWRQAIWDAAKADTLSLVAFEVGLFGWMAVVYFLLMPKNHSGPNSPVFWFMMQIGMFLGFLTTWPANWLLIKRGIKGGMH